MGETGALRGFRFEWIYVVYVFLRDYAYGSGLKSITLAKREYPKLDFATNFDNGVKKCYQVKSGSYIGSGEVTAILREFIALSRRSEYENSSFHIILKQRKQFKWLVHFKEYLRDVRNQGGVSLAIDRRVKEKLLSCAELFPILDIEIADENDVGDGSRGILLKLPEISTRVEKKRILDFHETLIGVKMGKILDANPTFTVDEFRKMCEELNREPDQITEVKEMFRAVAAIAPGLKKAPITYDEG